MVIYSLAASVRHGLSFIKLHIQAWSHDVLHVHKACKTPCLLLWWIRDCLCSVPWTVTIAPPTNTTQHSLFGKKIACMHFSGYWYCMMVLVYMSIVSRLFWSFDLWLFQGHFIILVTLSFLSLQIVCSQNGKIWAWIHSLWHQSMNPYRHPLKAL